jgi:hypothetical protein
MPWRHFRGAEEVCLILVLELEINFVLVSNCKTFSLNKIKKKGDPNVILCSGPTITFKRHPPSLICIIRICVQCLLFGEERQIWKFLSILLQEYEHWIRKGRGKSGHGLLKGATPSICLAGLKRTMKSSARITNALAKTWTRYFPIKNQMWQH